MRPRTVRRVTARSAAVPLPVQWGVPAPSLPPFGHPRSMQLPIEDHGIVGDLRTLALVGTDGTVDFMCWPRFDSPSVFASLLHDGGEGDGHDGGGGGLFELAPELADARRQQLYLPDTNVLLTRFLSADGVAEISDFMNVAGAGGPQRLVRRIKAVRGTVRVRMRCAPRFDYARAAHRASVDAGRVAFASDGEDGLRLRLCASVPLEIDGDDAVADFELGHGESACFTLDDPGDGPGAPDGAADEGGGAGPAEPHRVATAFKATSDWWRAWTARSDYRGRWRDIVNRSALVLKLLTSAEHGSIVAAGTFGLPETPGGERNWDYRYTWIRDAAFTVYGFVRVGHVEEANAFMRWLDRLTKTMCGDGTLDVMYRLDGGSDLAETELTRFTGHRGAVPVRVGNGAHDQLQLDIYGELMDAIYLADKYAEHVSHDAWINITKMLDHVEAHWQLPDEGIWEVRNGRREFLYSRLMCWVALDRGVRLATKRSLPAPVVRWTDARDAIHEDIHGNFWNADVGAFTQVKGGAALDASCLLMPLVRFIAPTDPRWTSTLDAVGRTLTDDSLVYRYSIEDGEDADGLDGVEGTFNMCSFWYIECLARSGDVEQARFLFDKMLGYANHLGIFAEETGMAGEQLGNFPQAFTHLALISAAHYLDRAL